MDDPKLVGGADLAERRTVVCALAAKVMNGAEVAVAVEVSNGAEVTLPAEARSEAQVTLAAQVESGPEVATAAQVRSEPEVSTAKQVQNVAEVPVKRKRGRPPKNHVKTAGLGAQPPQKKEEDEEDVCFICFDGGSLVLCDRRGCPKAYHPACIKRDEAFFQSSVKWNCGWHICSTCQKTSHYMCYTCTYSLCKGCSKDADYVCVRGNKGFCGLCTRTVLLIENIGIGNKERVQVDFDDKNSWEYLFKLYWTALKEKLSLTLDELTKAKNPWSGVGIMDCKGKMVELCNNINAKGSSLETSYGDLAPPNSKRRKIAEQLNFLNPEEFQATENPGIIQMRPLSVGTNWATKELLEFVAHMKNGDKSVLSQFDVQGLLLEYITRNNLRDPRQKNQIFCDTRLINLFGKTKLGYVEMLKLLESHFFGPGHPSDVDKVSYGVVQAVAGQLAVEGNIDSQSVANNSRYRTPKRVDDKKLWTNPDEHAIISVHNVNLIYLKRNLIENMLDEADKFLDKVVGSMVRVKIPGSEHLHRLVQVVGTSKATEPYKVGTRTTDVMLEILNLNNKEVVSIDGISNHEFSEDECSQLCQSMSSGLIRRLTVGEIQEKAIALGSVKVNDWLESGISKLHNPCDQASVNGDRTEQREYVEKLQIVNSAKAGQCRLNDIPIIQADNHMNPHYGSEGDTGQMDKKRRGNHGMLQNHHIGTQQKELISPQEGEDVPRDMGNKDEIALSYTALMESHVDDSETDKIWHYRDPCGKIQGPFPMMMLRMWSVNGFFPPDLRIWRISGKEDDSILLTDAMKGQFDSQSEMLHDNSLATQKPSNASRGRDRTLDIGGSVEMNAKQNERRDAEASWNSLQNGCDNGKNEFSCNNKSGSLSSPMPVHVNSDGGETRNRLPIQDSLKGDNGMPSQHQVSSLMPSSTFSGNGESLSHQLVASHGSEGWNSGLINVNVNLNEATEEQHILEQERQDDWEGKPGQSCGQSRQSSPINSSNRFDLNFGFVSMENHFETSEQSQKIDFPDLHCTTPKSSTEDLKAQATKTKEPVSSNVPVHNSGPTWSSTSSLVGGPRLPEVAGEWGQCSSPAKRTAKEWSLSIVPDSSIKRSELASDHGATPTSGIGLLMHSPTHHATDASDWQVIVNDPNDFTCLVDESVSDLLAEVEAMESLYAMASPTSKLRCSGQLAQGSGNDCFSPVISPAPDPGNSDALSSTNDLQMACHSTVINEPFMVAPMEALNAQKRSCGHSSSSVEVDEDTRPRDGSIKHCDARSNTKLSLPPSTSWGMVSTDNTRTTLSEAKTTESETARISWGQVQEDAHFNWGGFSQGASNPSWAPSHGTGQEAVRTNSRTHAGNGDHLQTQPRHPGSRDRDFLCRDLSFDKSKPSWNRQPYGGANGDIAFRTPPKGQRVCKFYESGYCRKGASCSYWHPGSS